MPYPNTLEDPGTLEPFPRTCSETLLRSMSAPCDSWIPWSPIPGTLLQGRLGPSRRLLLAIPGDPDASGGHRTPGTLLLEPSERH